MNARADAMQQSAQTNAEVTSAKAAEILRSLNDSFCDGADGVRDSGHGIFEAFGLLVEFIHSLA